MTPGDAGDAHSAGAIMVSGFYMDLSRVGVFLTSLPAWHTSFKIQALFVKEREGKLRRWGQEVKMFTEHWGLSSSATLNNGTNTKLTHRHVHTPTENQVLSLPKP